MSRSSGPTAVGRGDGVEEAERLLQKNAEWAEQRLRDDPDAFRKLAQGQHPPFLFIGCCDSRKPLDTITVTRPGELFIHRNIANLFTPGDVASGAVLEYAVLSLEVRHIIVCGHTRCGGMGAALRGVDGGVLGKWLAPVRRLAAQHADELEAIRSPSEREDRLSAINVVAQLENVLRHPCVTRRLAGEGPPLHLHGWVFHVETGRLEALPLPERRWIEEGLIPPMAEGDADGAASAAGVPDGAAS